MSHSYTTFSFGLFIRITILFSFFSLFSVSSPPSTGNIQSMYCIVLGLINPAKQFNWSNKSLVISVSVEWTSSSRPGMSSSDKWFSFWHQPRLIILNNYHIFLNWQNSFIDSVYNICYIQKKNCSISQLLLGVSLISWDRHQRQRWSPVANLWIVLKKRTKPG